MRCDGGFCQKMEDTLFWIKLFFILGGGSQPWETGKLTNEDQTYEGVYVGKFTG